MATFTGTANADSFVGADNVADTFNFTPANLGGSDTLIGGAGSGDRLNFTTAGILAASQFAHVGGIEIFGLANAGANRIGLTDPVVAAAGGAVTIDGAAGNDTVNGSALTAASRIVVNAGAGDDLLVGGQGADRFVFATTALTSADTVSGGAGPGDVLAFSAPGIVTAAQVAHVSGIETFALAAGANSLTLNNTAVAAAGGLLTIATNTGNDTVNGAALTGNNRIVVNAAGGNDSFAGGAGADRFAFAPTDLTGADTVSGGLGSDVLAFTAPGIIAATQLAHVGVIETFALANSGANRISLTDPAVAAAGGVVTIATGAGNDTVNGSALTGASRIVVDSAAGNDLLVGGAGADRFNFAPTDLTGGDTVSGGLGSDVLAFTAPGIIAATQLAHVGGIETFALANSGANRISMTNSVVAAAGGVVTIATGAGNDTVNGSALTAASRIVVDAVAGNDLLVGGAGADRFNFAPANLTGSDTVAGGLGSDVLAFTAPGIIAATQFAHVGGVETFVLADGANRIGVTDAVVTANGGTLRIVTGAGNDTVNGSALTAASRIVVNAAAGNDLLVGGGGADVFNIAPSDLTGADTVAGGLGSDVLHFTASGIISAAQLAHVGGVETLALAAGPNSLTLDNTAVAAAGGVLTVNTNTGDDGVNGSALTGTNHLIVNASSGDDVLVGGAGADRFNFTPGNLTEEDAVDGGGGSDLLNFTAPGDISALQLEFVDHVETFALAAGNNSIELRDSVVEQSGGHVLTINGNSGNDIVNAAALSAPNHVIVNAGGGNDVLRGGTGADQFNFAVADLNGADTVSGGVGPGELLRFTTAGTIVAAQLAHVDGIETFALANGANSLTLTDAVVAAAGGALTVIGNAGGDSLDAGALTGTNHVTLIGGAGDDQLFGGLGADNLNGGADNDVLAGGGGADTILGGAGGDQINGGAGADSLNGGLGGDLFVYNDPAELAPGEHIDGVREQSTFDAIQLLAGGTYDFGAVDARNIDGIFLGDAPGFDIVLSNQLTATADSDKNGVVGDLLISGTVTNGVTIDGAGATHGFRVDGSAFGGDDNLHGGDGADSLGAGGGLNTIVGGLGGDLIDVNDVGSFPISVFDGTQEFGTTDQLGLSQAGQYSFAGQVTNIDQIHLNADGAGFNLILDSALANSAQFADTTGLLVIDASVQIHSGVRIDGSAIGANGTLNVDGANLLGDDTMIGGVNSDTLTGGAGDDNLNGGGGDDLLIGGAGKDALFAGTGATNFIYSSGDEFVAGEQVFGSGETGTIDEIDLQGDGTYAFQNGTMGSIDRVVVQAGGVFNISVTDDMLAGADANQDGTSGDFQLSIASDFNLLVLDGHAIADPAHTIAMQGIAFSGAAFLTGGAGADTLTGGSSADNFTGGGGADQLSGGAGPDLFSFLFKNDFGDTLTDFDPTQDQLRFQQNDFTIGNGDGHPDNVRAGNNSAFDQSGTEIGIKTDAGVATADIQGQLNSYVNVIAPALFVFLDTTKGHAVVYYDPTGGSTHDDGVLVADLNGMTDLPSLGNLGAEDFLFN